MSPVGRLKVDLLSTVTAATIDSHAGRTYLSCVGEFFLLLFPLGSLRQHILRVNSPCSGAASYVNCFRKCSYRRNVISNNSTGISQFTRVTAQTISIGMSNFSIRPHLQHFTYLFVLKMIHTLCYSNNTLISVLFLYIFV